MIVLIGHLSDRVLFVRKKGAPKRSLKPEGRKKTTLSGTDPYRNPRRIPSSPEVRTDFHDLARLITRMRFHPNKDGHSDFCLKLHAGCRCAVSFHTMIFYCLWNAIWRLEDYIPSGSLPLSNKKRHLAWVEMPLRRISNVISHDTTKLRI